MRYSGKTVIQRTQTPTKALPSEFVKDDFDALLGGRGYKVIHEKAYLCPCKAKESGHRSTCKNCGGTGWIFANPTETRMVITGIMLDDKLKEGPLREWGQIDKGACKITANNIDKLSYMDRIRNIDATAEHDQLLFPVLRDDGSELFAYTKYDIKSIDFIGLYEGDSVRIKRLIENTDYTFRDNVITFSSAYNSISDMCVTIRYVHNPEFHVIEVLRESMTSYNDKKVKLVLPVHAVAMRAHLVPDVENFDGDRLIDNSWKPSACEDVSFTAFQRQLKYASAQEIFDNLSASQISALDALIHA